MKEIFHHDPWRNGAGATLTKINSSLKPFLHLDLHVELTESVLQHHRGKVFRTSIPLGFHRRPKGKRGQRSSIPRVVAPWERLSA